MNSSFRRSPMSSTTRLTVALIASGLLIGCSTIDVRTDWDREVDFSTFETFALLEDSGPSMGRLIDTRIRNAIVEQLTARGLRQLESAEGADLAIGFQVATHSRRTYRTVSTGWRATGYQRGRRGWNDRTSTVSTTTRTRAREYTVGALILAIFDGKDKELVWQGSGSRRLDSSGGPERSEQMIRESVERMLRDFPPGR